jgi:hypothetical protein
MVKPLFLYQILTKLSDIISHSEQNFQLRRCEIMASLQQMAQLSIRFNKHFTIAEHMHTNPTLQDRNP